MVIIKNDTIPYLDERILNQNSYNNVTLLSVEGPQLKMNSLILCALSHTLKMAFHEDDDYHTIITEFSLEELKQVKEFCMRGSCNSMSQSILEAFGLLKKGEIKLSNNNDIEKKPLSKDEFSNNEDYKCESCGKSFSRLDNLKRHMHTVHEGRKDSKCEDKSFTEAESLKKHIHTVHEGQKIKPTLQKINEKNNDIITQIPYAKTLYSQKAQQIYESTMINTKIRMKNEEIDVIDEIIKIEDMEYDIAKDYIIDEFLPSPVKKDKRKKKLDYDDDWEPKVKRNKANVKLTQGFETEIEMKNENIDIIDEPKVDENMEYDVAMDYFSDYSLLNHVTDNIRKKKPKQEKNDWGSGIIVRKPLPLGPQGKLSEKLLAESDPNFKTFELPNPLEDYKKQPVEMSNKMYERSKDKEQKWSGITIHKAFTCSHCQLRFMQHYKIINHEIKYHQEHLQCNLCPRVNKLEDVEEFKMHVFNHIVLGLGGLSECIQCGRTWRKGFYEHVRYYGPLHNEECTQCSKKMSSFKEYQEHVNEQHYGVWKYRCGFDNCGEIFDSAIECRSHTSSIHHKKIVVSTGLPKKVRDTSKKVCEICGALVTTTYIKRHVCKSKQKERQQAKTYPCTKCKQVFPSESERVKHKRNIDTPCHKYFMTFCQLCGKSIALGARMNHMISFHTKPEDKPFKCTTCGKGFNQRNHLKDHINIHTGEKPYKCLYCPSAFASKGTHAMHQKGHLGIKRSHGKKRMKLQ